MAAASNLTEDKPWESGRSVHVDRLKDLYEDGVLLNLLLLLHTANPTVFGVVLILYTLASAPGAVLERSGWR
jgi:hypothetical protein